ncbi:hypothetical protein BPUTSESOX_932 [uncultured Gammaproteobacteria bacterium]|jgi:hypothetical protein|uniref:hypothetical protein n=1 Tax=thiotrophic endosymbiont of Bathymodiolus puteoserpentis (Logatchev) TaxID=343240 RepID=UPI0010B7E52F|nr:hypothetical protein [thiotrophic endosymbiont of Bathymodiolus puteoserpentis (Logatchev)]CAC9485085.1 hypothetical protein [uncultured Gammaproteobacteria bacterium]CAC9502513.1 hypothetical protein [uncultured Gammaproteobacteria bacterium]CAC9643221.1 hypothetical protein [uncultured Gammaproteobacteria bacterium]SSC09884.1 hypothetical protein BPUTEOSOX_739 [thiotrophic endosymbiont of Bathymodiolus puteoserpentis (Logatchev)]VVH50553.1 hypothetical protein BPUTSESOX_932 [uncultured Ga
MQNMLHNYKIGCISASQTIVITGIFLLIWAFGSYLVYVLTVPNPILCFPPLSGCVTISHAGDYPFSGFFYRLLVLPLAPLLGLSMYFIVQFLQNINPNIHPNIRRILVILGSVILPISFILSEAFKDGHQLHPQYVADLHLLTSVIAFLSLIIFQIVASFHLPKARGMLFLSLLPVFIVIFQYSTHIQYINAIVEWNVFISIIVWNILIGRSLRK